MGNGKQIHGRFLAYKSPHIYGIYFSYRYRYIDALVIFI